MKTILFAEDEPSLQLILADALRKEGYKVLTAPDGEVALDILRKKKPDFVLLDLIMPKKDGFEVLKEMKANEKIKDLPVIVLTNLEGGSDVENAMSLGASTFLVKTNYRIDEILVKIKEFLK